MKQGRPRQAPTRTVRIRVDQIKAVEKILKRRVAENQTPHVMVRMTEWERQLIKEVLQ